MHRREAYVSSQRYVGILKCTASVVNQGGTADKIIRPWQKCILPRTFCFYLQQEDLLCIYFQNDGVFFDIDN